MQRLHSDPGWSAVRWVGLDFRQLTPEQNGWGWGARKPVLPVERRDRRGSAPEAQLSTSAAPLAPPPLLRRTARCPSLLRSCSRQQRPGDALNINGNGMSCGLWSAKDVHCTHRYRITSTCSGHCHGKQFAALPGSNCAPAAADLPPDVARDRTECIMPQGMLQ